MERAAGIEPARPAWKAGALPLHHARARISGKEKGSKRQAGGERELAAERIWDCRPLNLRALRHDGVGHGLAREFRPEGVRSNRGSVIHKRALYRLLSNRVYIGEAVHKRTAYPGEHAAIIDRALWDRVHAIMQQSPRTRASCTRAQTPALLNGLLFGPGGTAFSPTHTRKRDRLYRYYVSQAVLKHGANGCPVGRVPAGGIEGTVIDQLRAVFRQPEIVVGAWRAARGQNDSITEAEVRDALLQLDPLWDELFPAEQARIVQLLVDRVEIAEDGLDIRFRTEGLGGLVREFGIDARAAA